MSVEQALRALEPAWPDTPELAAAVRPRLEPPRRPTRPRLVVAIALTALLLTGTAVAAIPPLREWIDDLFGGRVEVREVPKVPPGPPLPDGGPARSLAEAQRRAGFRAPWPRLFEQPRFRARPGQLFAASERLLFTAQRGEVPFEFVRKLVGPGTRARRVQVGAVSGIWIEGKPHAVILRRPDGVVVEERLHLAANTLVWPQDDLVLRVEGAATLREALTLALSVR